MFFMAIDYITIQLIAPIVIFFLEIPWNKAILYKTYNDFSIQSPHLFFFF